jgi:hypothetical protein
MAHRLPIDPGPSTLDPRSSIDRRSSTSDRSLILGPGSSNLDRPRAPDLRPPTDPPPSISDRPWILEHRCPIDSGSSMPDRRSIIDPRSSIDRRPRYRTGVQYSRNNLLLQCLTPRRALPLFGVAHFPRGAPDFKQNFLLRRSMPGGAVLSCRGVYVPRGVQYCWKNLLL